MGSKKWLCLLVFMLIGIYFININLISDKLVNFPFMTRIEKEDPTSISSTSGSMTIKNFTKFHESSQNVTYNHSIIKLKDEEGIYQALFNFENDTIGNLPQNFSVVVLSQNCTAKIIPELDGHKKVLELFDNNTNNRAEIKNTFTARTNGTVEYYIRTSDRTKLSIVSGNGTYWFNIGSNNFYLVNWTGSFINLGKVFANRWYHIALTFEYGYTSYDGLGFQQYALYLDGIRHPTVGGYDMWAPAGNLYKTVFSTSTSHANYSLFVDALDYSWADDYYLNRNLNLESNYTDGYYISDDISLGGLMQIDNIDNSSMVYQNASLDIKYYDFNTDTWMDETNYKGTLQRKFKFKVLINTTTESNAMLYNLTLNYTKFYPSFGNILQSPRREEVYYNDIVSVFAEIKRGSYPVKDIYLNWTNDNWSSFTLTDMILFSNNTYENYSTNISKQTFETLVRYKVFVRTQNDSSFLENTSIEFNYTVIDFLTTFQDLILSLMIYSSMAQPVGIPPGLIYIIIIGIGAGVGISVAIVLLRRSRRFPTGVVLRY